MTTHETVAIPARGAFPNSRHPVLLWRGVWQDETASDNHAPDYGARIAARFAEHGWGNGWRAGVYAFHHFHATAHEVLGCATGWAEIQLGGPEGPIVRLDAGDVALLPAGVGHCCRDSSSDYAIIGAYPPGQSPDMERGDPDRYAVCAERAAAVPVPEMDPVDGAAGAVQQNWNVSGAGEALVDG